MSFGSITTNWGTRYRISPPDPDRPESGTIRCAACSWRFTGPILEGSAAHLAHRTAQHPALAVSTTRYPRNPPPPGKKPRPSPRSKDQAARLAENAASVRIMLAELERGPRTAKELGELVGVTAVSVGVQLAWARRKGTAPETLTLNPHCAGNQYAGCWSLEPLGPQLPAKKERGEQAERARQRRREAAAPIVGKLIEALRDGPKTATALGEATGLSPGSVGRLLASAMRDGLAISNHRASSTWSLESPSEVN